MVQRDRMGERQRPWRDKEKLKSAYSDTSNTVQEIAEEFGCSPETISRWVNRFNIKNREKYGGPWTDREKLVELYWGEGLSQAEIADELDCHQGTISDWFDRHNISARYLSKKAGSLSTTEQGYEYFNGGNQIVWVHQLLLIAGGEDPHEVFGHGTNCHHKTEVPWDNRPGVIELLSTGEHANQHRDTLIENRDYKNPVIDAQLCMKLRQEYAEGETMDELSDKYDAGTTTVRHHIREECKCEHG